MTGPLLASPRRLLRIATVLGLTLVSALVLIDHVRLSRWIGLHRSTVAPAEIVQLEGKLSQLDADIAAARRQPTSVSNVAYAAAEKTQNDRLDRIEHSLADRVAPADLAALAARLTRLEGEVWRVRHPAQPRVQPLAERAVPPAAPTAREAPELIPPFTVLGTELRGGERFLTVAPRGAQALSQVRVLRTGEADGEWRLQALDQHAAVFQVAGHLQHVPVP